LKKHPKTFLNLVRWCGGGGASFDAPDLKSFFASFCSQKEVLWLFL
jgi:hypothetical protein